MITRFEDMKAPIAALLWGRVLFQQTLDPQQILDYFNTEAELHNPEPQCAAPSPTLAPAGSPSVAPSASPAASPSVEPSAAPSTSPAASPSAS